jgi:hypothetical protein
MAMIEFRRDFFRLGLKCFEYGIIIRIGRRFRVIGKEIKQNAGNASVKAW